ncbi:MAG: hypothetical protein EOM25_12985, partial [Deltaproteobacteria bacterium]|nr:hypothetical protein [Deltaproteobacteria bacterium]
MAALAPGWSGGIESRGALAGAPRSPELLADLDARLSRIGTGTTPGVSGRLAGRLAARPAETAGAMDLHGDWGGEPAFLSLRFEPKTAGTLDLSAAAGLLTPAGPTELRMTARWDRPGHGLSVQRLDLGVPGLGLRLLAPVQVALRPGLGVDRLRLGLVPNQGQGSSEGTLELAGELSPRLDARLDLVDLSLGLARLIPGVPQLAGRLDGQLLASGTLAAPAASLRIQSEGVRLLEGPGRAIPPGALELSAELARSATELALSARVPERAELRLRGRLAGSWPAVSAPLNLNVDGHLDLSLLDPWLAGAGRRIQG